MVQIDRFSAIHYRGISGLSLSHLSKVNLITGDNGVGKTALLEAIWLFTGRYNPSTLWNAVVQRSSNPILNPISRLADNQLELSGSENSKQQDLKWSYESIDGMPQNSKLKSLSQSESTNIPPIVGSVHTFIDGKSINKGTEGIQFTPFGGVLIHSPNAMIDRPSCVIENANLGHDIPADYLQRYSRIVIEGHKKDFMKALKMVVKNLENVEILNDISGESYLALSTRGAKPRPVNDMGGGASRIVRLLLSFCEAKNGVLLSDELENGIHYSIQHDLWRIIRRWIDEWDVQFIATTHNAEFIDAAIDAFEDDAERLAVHKLYNNQNTGKVQVSTYTGDSLRGARDLNLEMR